MATQTTNDVIERVRTLIRDNSTNGAVRFFADTIVTDMEREGAQPLDEISLAALRVFAKKLNVSASWLIEGKPGNAASELLTQFDAASALGDRQVVFLMADWNGLRHHIERLPDAA